MNEQEIDFQRFKLALAQNGRRVSAAVMQLGCELTDTGHTNGPRQKAVTFYFSATGDFQGVTHPLRAWWRLGRKMPLKSLIRA